MASFVFASNGMKCALSISKLLYPSVDVFEYRLSLVTGNPIDKQGHGLFEETKKKIRYLSEIGANNRILVDTATERLITKEHYFSSITGQKKIRIISDDDFSFLQRLLSAINDRLPKSDFKSEHLCTALGLSKAQTYRKTRH